MLTALGRFGMTRDNHAEDHTMFNRTTRQAAIIAVFAVMAAPVLFSATGVRAQESQEAPPSSKPAGEATAYIKLTTTLGDIVLELDREKAPISVENFLKYVAKEHYDGTIFHRVMPNFMIQGGGFTADMEQLETEAPIKNEWQNGLKNVRGSIAMARTSEPDSATCQFFINTVDNPALDTPRNRQGQPIPASEGAAYAVFGKVIAGMDTVDAIRVVPTTNREAKGRPGAPPMQNVPVDPVVIESARTISAADAKALEGKPLMRTPEKPAQP